VTLKSVTFRECDAEKTDQSPDISEKYTASIFRVKKLKRGVTQISARLLLDLLVNPEDGSSALLLNEGKLLHHHTSHILKDTILEGRYRI
jgi:hypothetical protein